MKNQQAQSVSNCTFNGKPVDCGDFFAPLAAFGIVILIIMGVLLFCFIFWVISLIHLFSHDDIDERMVWILLVLLVPFMQFVYFFGPRRSYNKQKAKLAPDGQKQ